MVSALDEVARFESDEIGGELAVSIPPDADVRRIRSRTGLTQVELAAKMRVPVSTIRNWEQGRRVPDTPARVLLALIERNPNIVEETLGGVA